MKERLIKILEDDYDFRDFTGEVDDEALADHLLKNGIIILPCKNVYYIDNKLLMSKPIDFLKVYEVIGIDEDGKYWSTLEKAMAHLEKLKG